MGIDTQLQQARLEARLFGAPHESAPMVGRFTVIERLGEGGMGTVFAAWDPHLGRRIALKLLRSPIDANAEYRARLLREAQALAKLAHPNVLTIHDVGTMDDTVFLALELVEGESLADRMRAQDPLPVKEALELLVQTGHGLAAAHAVGLVHRDVKPSNVLVGVDGRVRVADFGLVRAAEDTRTETAAAHIAASPDGLQPTDADTPRSDGLVLDLGKAGRLVTQAGAVVGTPGYMAPEQIDGAVVDARTDQFALAAVGYRMLEGKLPFAGATLLAVRVSIAHGDVRFSRTPRGVAKILRRALAEDPGSRFASVDELVAEMERHRRGPARVRMAALGGVAITATGFAVWSQLAAGSPDPCGDPAQLLSDAWNDERRVATRAAFEAIELPYVARAWSLTAERLDGYAARWQQDFARYCEATWKTGTQSGEALDLQMRCLTDRRRELAALTAVLVEANAAIVERAPAAVAALPDLAQCEDIERLRQVGVPPDAETQRRVDEVRELVAMARTRVRTSDHDQAGPSSIDAVDRAREIGWDPLVAEALLVRGVALQEGGSPQDAESVLREAVDVAEGARHDRVLAEAWIELLANVGDFQERTTEVEPLRRRALATLHRIGDPPELTAYYLDVQGRVDVTAGDFAAAIGHHEESLALIDANPELPVERRMVALMQLATAESAFGRTEQAIEHRMASLAIAREVYGPDHPRIGVVLGQLGVDYMEKPDHAAALRALDEAIELDQRLGLAHPSSAASYANRGQLKVQMGRAAEAGPDFERAIQLYTDFGGPQHPRIGTVMLQQSTVLLVQQRFEEAAVLLREADEHLARTFPEDHPLRAAAKLNLASALVATGGLDEAVRLVTDALAIYERVLDPISDEIAMAYVVRGEIHAKKGAHERALADYAEASTRWGRRSPEDPRNLPDLRMKEARSLAALGRAREARARAEDALGLLDAIEGSDAERTVVREWLTALR